ncbi:MAG: cytidylate kinase-like family protein [Syntrophales bacterium]|nr:cytidylate kinase-like family protein [Syntrophales bacterium]MDD5232601.1 cytidylate kinase-like family protein [Syntrophales bacterium]MDD5531313.1 cytidylate kinase-like family protein [Syntrophales bacterium]HPL62183.1 cytidylate kinase-like family protein [Syntrophales bacterium]
MKPKITAATVQQLVEEQIQRWTTMGREKKKKPYPVVTISREAGSGGREVARYLAEYLKLDLYGSRIVSEVAKSAKMSTAVVETLDEKGRSMLEDWISILETEKNLWGYEYLRHLTKVIGTIGRHGRAVIVGRGAHLILPAEETFRVRIVAPMEARIKNFQKEFKLSAEEARKRIIVIESDRNEFIRKYFHADIADSSTYDLTINTSAMDPKAAAQLITAAICLSNKMSDRVEILKPALTSLFR